MTHPIASSAVPRNSRAPPRRESETVEADLVTDHLLRRVDHAIERIGERWDGPLLGVVRLQLHRPLDPRVGLECQPATNDQLRTTRPGIPSSQTKRNRIS